jgi:hypothetical protein
MTAEIRTERFVNAELYRFSLIWKENPGYVPTIKSPVLAQAIKSIGKNAWNNKANRNW